MKVGFFEEQAGVKSSMRLFSFISLLASIGMAFYAIAMRLFSFISLLASIGMAFYAIATKQLDMNTLVMITVFLSVPFGAKAGQKLAEAKSQIKEVQ
jgi:EamA domain-containing membrane protein RarD